MPLLVTLFLRTVMKLLKHDLQLFRNRKPQMSGILQKGNPFIGKVEENDSRPEYAAGSDDLSVKHMPDSDQQEDKHLPADSPETDLA